MKVRKITPRLLTFLLLMSVLVSACSSDLISKPTEVEIIIGPPTPDTAASSTPVPTPTLRPTATPTEMPTEGPTVEPSPTNTLDPYHDLVAQALELRANSEFDQAVIKLSEAIRMEPENPLAFYERGRVYMDQNKPDDAITEFNFAINYDPNFIDAYNARGVAWMIKQQFNQALVELNKAIELDPQEPKAYTNRATLYILTDKFDEAVADYSKVIELRPDDPESYYNRGQGYVTMIENSQNVEQEAVINLADLCIADFNQANSLVPDVSDNYTNRGVCYMFKNDLENAYGDFSKAIELDPENFKTRLLRAAIYPDFGTKEESLADAQYVLDNATDAEFKTEAQKMLNTIPTLPTPTPTA